MRKQKWILARNGEYLGRYDTLEEAQAAKDVEQAQLEKLHAQGWFESLDQFRLDVFQG